MRYARATAAATRTYAERFPEIRYLQLGDTGLEVSGAGFGAYRIDTSFPHHRQALRKALLSGINLVDTSANYTGGGSELLIGSVVEDLENEGALLRNEIVIVSKAGYLQGRVYNLSQNLKKDGRAYPDLVEYAPNLEHCVHPAFLEDQLTASLGRLNCGAVDVFLLHNPEYYLMWAQKQAIDAVTAQSEYYRRIRVAFEHLEKEVGRGRIGSYGISSNTFPVPESDYDHTSLERVIKIANEISPLHNFKVVQMPFNLIEHGAATSRTANGFTALELAHRHNLGVLVNRPLNAIFNSGLVRLSEENGQANELRQTLAQLDKDWEAPTLSQAAVRALRSTTGVHSVLVGMREESYVADIVAELTRQCPIRDRRESWGRLANSIFRPS